VTEIRISPLVQLILLLLVAAGIAGVIAAQLPEIQRYLKVRRM
jgi:archaellum component FlaG (FlaF/FlaG flagellin family)